MMLLPGEFNDTILRRCPSILKHSCDRFSRAMLLYISAAYAVERCLSVRPSLTSVYSVETKRTYLQFFLTIW